MDFNLARHNMIEQQIRTWEVLDQFTLDTIADVHREDFVPAAFKSLAFADTPIPLAHNQVTMTPKIEARILQSVEPKSPDKVLEIGTGCGYMTALLAKSCNFVYSVDIYPDFIRDALEKLQAAGISNIELASRDGLDGWVEHAPYDVIVVTGSVPRYLPAFQEQLSVSGRLFLITGSSPVMQANLVTRVSEESFTREVLFETDVPPLDGIKKPDSFSF